MHINKKKAKIILTIAKRGGKKTSEQSMMDSSLCLADYHELCVWCSVVRRDVKQTCHYFQRCNIIPGKDSDSSSYLLDPIYALYFTVNLNICHIWTFVLLSCHNVITKIVALDWRIKLKLLLPYHCSLTLLRGTIRSEFRWPLCTEEYSH